MIISNSYLYKIIHITSGLLLIHLLSCEEGSRHDSRFFYVSRNKSEHVENYSHARTPHTINERLPASNLYGAERREEILSSFITSNFGFYRVCNYKPRFQCYCNNLIK